MGKCQFPSLPARVKLYVVENNGKAPVLSRGVGTHPRGHVWLQGSGCCLMGSDPRNAHPAKDAGRAAVP